MKKSFQASLKSHFQHFIHLLFLLFLLGVGFVYLTSNYGAKSNSFFAMFFGIVAVLLLILHFVIYIKYVILSRSVVIMASENGRIFEVLGNDTKIRFSVDDIKKAEIHESCNASKGTIHWYPWDGFSYAKLFLKNERIIYITSITVPNLSSDLCRVNFSKHMSIYPIPQASKWIGELSDGA